MTTRLEADATSLNWFKMLFLLAALYDGVLGVAFLFFYGPIYQSLGVPLPNSPSYIHLSAAFVLAQGVGYWFVYRNMLRNVDLVKVGVVYKAAYTLVSAYYLLAGQLLHAMFAWFAVCDLLFLLAFVRFLVLAQPAGLEAERR